MNLQKELEKWAEETADFYDKKATSGDPNFDIAFYTQSDLTKIKESPDLLILGINPGFGGSYSEQKQNPKWQELGIDGRMNGTTLLKGNPEKPNEWKRPNFWQRLNIIFNLGEIKDILQNESRFVLSNLTFFATQNEKLLPNGIFEDCTAKTIKLINILRPKHILCLGGENCINPLMKEGNFKVKYLLPFGCLSYAKFNGIPVYGIRHTTYRYTKEEMNLVGKCLKYLLDNPNKDFSVEEKEIQEKFTDDIKALKERKSNKTEYFHKWVDQLEEDFPNYQIKKDKINNKSYPQISVVLDLKEIEITVEMSGRNLFYGFPKNVNIEENVTSFLAEFTPNTSWYGCKQTSFENGYNDFKALIEKVEH